MLLPLLFCFLVVLVSFGFCTYVVSKITQMFEEYELSEPQADDRPTYDHSPLKMRAYCVEIAEAFVMTENATFEVRVYDIEQFCYDFTLATGLQIVAMKTEDPEIWHIKEKK